MDGQKNRSLRLALKRSLSHLYLQPPKLTFRRCRNTHIAHEDDAPEWESFQGTVLIKERCG